MEKNQTPINKILERLGVDPKGSEKDQIIDFSVSFAHKLVRKCIQQKQGLTSNKKIKPQDVRHAYQTIKMIRSPELTQKQEERQRKIIQKTNKNMLQDQMPCKATTVKLHFSNNLEHMMTNKERQLTFQ